MQKMTIFLFILPFLCGLLLINVDGSKTSLASSWLFACDFQPDELANLTPQEEHQLMLKSLLKRRPKEARFVMYFEILGKVSGIELCRLTEDESTNRENIATMRAYFECVAKLPFQMQSAWILGNKYVNENLEVPSDLVKAFSKICSIINQRLENITFYTERRDHYRKTDLWQPKKIYLYSIPKSEDDFRQQLTNFANDPEVKKLFALVAFVWYSDDAEEKWPGKRVLMRLAQEPGKLEVVQKIHDESIFEMVPDINDVPLDRIELSKEMGRNLSDFAIAIYKKVKAKIYANADLMELVTKWQSPDSPDYIPGLSKKL